MLSLFSHSVSTRSPSRIGFIRRFSAKTKHGEVGNINWPPSCDKVTQDKLKYLVDTCAPNNRLLSKNAPSYTAKSNATMSQSWKRLLITAPLSPEKLTKTFESLYDPNRSIPPTLMNIIIGAYGKMELGHRILDVVVQETKRGLFVPQTRHLTNLIGALGRSGDLEAALTLYYLMIPLEIDCITFISMVDVLSRSHHPDLAFSLWKDWQKTTRCYPILNVFTTLSEAAIRARRFDLFQEAEMAARELYHKAVAEKRIARMADSQYTPKHCIHLSRLLLYFWFPTLRPITPKPLKENVKASLQNWIDVRPALPGSPLTSHEISRWETDVDMWISCNDLYAPSRDVTSESRLRALEIEEEDDRWLDPSDYSDDAELDKLIRNARSL